VKEVITKRGKDRGKKGGKVGKGGRQYPEDRIQGTEDTRLNLIASAFVPTLARQDVVARKIKNSGTITKARKYESTKKQKHEKLF
jgi:hypothetical protein